MKWLYKYFRKWFFHDYVEQEITDALVEEAVATRKLYDKRLYAATGEQRKLLSKLYDKEKYIHDARCAAYKTAGSNISIKIKVAQNIAKSTYTPWPYWNQEKETKYRLGRQHLIEERHRTINAEESLERLIGSGYRKDYF